MKLKRIHIREFQSIRDSNPVDVGDITCFVGKNESGKTALLQALYRLNPIEPAEGRYDITDDYPRAQVTDYQRAVEAKEQEHAIVIQATFAIEDEELEPLNTNLGQGVLPEPEVTLEKGYANKTRFRFETDERVAGKSLLKKANIQQELGAEGGKWTNLKELAGILEKRAQRLETEFKAAQETAAKLTDPDEKNKALAEAQLLQETNAAKNLRALLSEINKTGLSEYAYRKYIDPHLPKFLYFSDYYQMHGCENIEVLKQRIAQKTLKPSDHPLLGLVELARLNLDELLNPARTRELKNKLEGASNHLTKQVMKYWSQNKHLRMSFDVRPARPQDPPGMQQGTNIWAEVYDSRHLVSTELGTRSRGFVWFFSFLAWYSRLRSTERSLILLLDEPGLFLHAKAQEDLLRYFEEELKPQHQLIYTTHSPFMVDPRHFERIRIVQDKSIDADGPVPVNEEGTKLLVDVLEATGDSLFPLQGALGYEIYQTLFIGPDSLVVEGVSDLLYIQTMSAILNGSRREGLSEKWTITPVGGADKVPTFVALMGSQKGLTIATLIDLQKHHSQMIENMYTRKLLKKNRVLTFADFTGKEESDVEDMFDLDFYLTLVNSEYEKQLQKPIKPSDLGGVGQRILLALERFLDHNPLRDEARFNHYRPARYLVENMGLFASQLSERTLGRFEKAFKALNRLLS